MYPYGSQAFPIYNLSKISAVFFSKPNQSSIKRVR